MSVQEKSVDDMNLGYASDVIFPSYFRGGNCEEERSAFDLLTGHSRSDQPLMTWLCAMRKPATPCPTTAMGPVRQDMIFVGVSLMIQRTVSGG